VNDATYAGEIALVTGGNKGIGKQIVRRLATEGLTVYLGARDKARGEAAAGELAATGADVRLIQLDVTEPSQVEAAAARIATEHGRLDVLVNNAGVIEPEEAPEATTVEQLRRTYEVNVFGVVAVTRACLPLLRRATVGRVVNLSTPLGSLSLHSDPQSMVANAGMLAYASSKATVNALTLMYANALRGENILVNAVNPGFVATDMNGHQGVLTAEQGAEAPVRLALLGPDGPTGTFHGRVADFTDETMREVVDAVLPW
jgi:NAD(P)-dependent dehydrogenase (short-subunit alcohol dehydrogenase family)